MINKFESFTPLMHSYEYEFIAKYLTPDDILLEWGSGNSTIYFSGLVKKLISVEHDDRWYKKIKKVVEQLEIDNVEQYNINAHTPDPIPCRYEQFKDYIEFPKKEQLKFTKVLIDGRARKYCAKSIVDYINEDCVIFIHDFNREDYQKVLKYYDAIEILTDGQGIAALKKKAVVKLSTNKEY